jgi:hypothetical protein
VIPLTPLPGRWLGIDPGLAIIGWALLAGDDARGIDLLDYGTIETDKTRPTPARLVEIERDVGAFRGISTGSCGHRNAFF